MIGELDSFQREHEQKMMQKKREKLQHKSTSSGHTNHDMHNTSGGTTITASSTGDMSDIYNSFDKLSINCDDSNPLMCSTATHCSDMTLSSDAVDGFNDLTDCQATTRSLKLNLSTTEHPLVMQNSSNSMNGANSNGSPVVHSIELIPDGYNVSDDYVKEHTEIVVLRRKDDQNELGVGAERSSNHNNVTRDNVDGTGGIERISSFRCSSFAKTDSVNHNDGNTTLKRGQSISAADSIAQSNRYKNDEYTHKTPVMMNYDDEVVDHSDNDHETAQMIRQKPIITPRPASLSGLFLFFFSFFFSICIFIFSSQHFIIISFSRSYSRFESYLT